MRGALTLCALGVSCYTSSPAPSLPQAPAAPEAVFTVGSVAVGPITAKTPATLIALRAALLGFEVKPAHIVLGGNVTRLGYTIYGADGERLLQVIPDAAGAIRSVHALSPKVAVADRPWTVGAKLSSVRALSTCRCFAEESVVCFRPGDHVAVAVARECSYDSYAGEDQRQELLGLAIRRVLWSPRPYTADSEPYGGGQYAGDEYGGL